MIVHSLGEGNSLLNKFVAEIRDANIQRDSMRFRRNIERIGEILGYELSKTLDYRNQTVETPLGTEEMSMPIDDLVLCSVLRDSHYIRAC